MTNRFASIIFALVFSLLISCTAAQAPELRTFNTPGPPSSTFGSFDVPESRSSLGAGDTPEQYLNLISRSSVVAVATKSNNLVSFSTGIAVLHGKDEYILTASHSFTRPDGTIDPDPTISLVTPEGRLFPSSIVYYSILPDLAKLKPNDLITYSQLSSLPAMPGDEVYAVGFQMHPEPRFVLSVCYVVSLGLEYDELAGFIRPGFSGGPVFNKEGKVVGITVAYRPGEERGLYIPVRRIISWLEGK
jgi:S1-C subfamily serine protease